MDPILPIDIERLILERTAEHDIPFARKVLVLLNKRTQAWLDPIIYRHVVFHDAHTHPVVNKFIDAISTKPSSFQSTAIQTLLIPLADSVSLRNLIKVLTTCKSIRNLGLATFGAMAGLGEPSPALRAAATALPLDILHTFLGFRPFRPSILEGEAGKNIWSNARIIIIADKAEQWMPWDWERYLHGNLNNEGSNSRSEEPVKRLRFISLCADCRPVQFNLGCPFVFEHPSEGVTNVEVMLSGVFEKRTHDNVEDASKSNQSHTRKIRVRICCVHPGAQSDLYDGYPGKLTQWGIIMGTICGG